MLAGALTSAGKLQSFGRILALEAPLLFPEQRGERLNALRLNVSPGRVEDRSDLATATCNLSLFEPRHFQHHKSCRGKLKPEVCSFW